MSGAPRALPLRLLFSLVLAGATTFGTGCGGSPPTPASLPGLEWPTLAPSPPDAVTVASALGSADGSLVRVRAYLVSVTTPCPACNVARGVQYGAAQGVSLPGCAPCPRDAMSFADEPKLLASAPTPPLRAVGAAEGLQPRHVGRMFLLTGTFHAAGSAGAGGPELEVTDVRALEMPAPALPARAP